jgi:RNA binding exosome subunit
MRVFAHATEDLDKVLTAARNTLPTESIDTVAFKRANLTGHYGNPIILLEARVKDKNIAQAVLERLSLGLSMLDKQLLGSEIVQHLENGNLYIRLGKQSAYLNELRFNSTDPIHLRIHFKRHSPEEIVGICKKFGLFI